MNKLLKEGVNVNATSSYFENNHEGYLNGATAFIAAVNENANTVAKLLKSKPGIDLTLTNANFENALHR